jgi:hypothetical protein
MMLATWEWFWSRPSWHWSYAWAAAFLVLPSSLGAAAETAMDSTRTQLDQFAAQADQLFPDG